MRAYFCCFLLRFESADIYRINEYYRIHARQPTTDDRRQRHMYSLLLGERDAGRIYEAIYIFTFFHFFMIVERI